jgi:hypothetical protein
MAPVKKPVQYISISIVDTVFIIKIVTHVAMVIPNLNFGSRAYSEKRKPKVVEGIHKILPMRNPGSIFLKKKL